MSSNMHKNKPLRLLMTVSTYKPHLDGVQFVTSYLAEGLAAKGHDVTVLTRAYPNLPDEEVIHGVAVKRLSVNSSLLHSSGDKAVFYEYICQQQDNYDVLVNVCTQAPLTDWTLPVIHCIKKPVVLHLHSMWKFGLRKSDFTFFKVFAAKLLGNLRWGWYFVRYASAFKKYSAVLQLHEKDSACRFFKRFYGIDSTILENAAEQSFFFQEGIQKKKTIVYVANYMKGKNQKRCVDLFMRSGIQEDWTLLLLGSKESGYYRELRKYCEERYPEALDKRIQLLVGVDRSRLCEMVKESSLFMMTSLTEAFPISIIEAMAAKVPYISTDVGIVKHLGGGVIARSDEAFIAYLQKYTQDDAARERLAQQAYDEALQHYQIADKVDQLEQLLQQLASKGQKE